MPQSGCHYNFLDIDVIRSGRYPIKFLLPEFVSYSLFHDWANVLWYPGGGLPGDKESVHPYGSQSKQGQSPNSVSMLGQRQIRLNEIETAMGCDTGPTLNRYWVGRPTFCVRGTSYRRVR